MVLNRSRMMIRIIKSISLSCLIVLLMISVLLNPVSATVEGLQLKDYFISRETADNGYTTAVYSFESTPLTIVTGDVSGSGGSYTGDVWYDPPSDEVKVTFLTYILGSSSFTGSGVIDVSDLKMYSSFDLSAQFVFNYVAVDTGGNIQFKHLWSVRCYDASGTYLGTTTSAVSTGTPPADLTESIQAIGVDGTVSLLEGTCYIMPTIRMAITFNSCAQPNFRVSQLDDFQLTVGINMIYENSQTMIGIRDDLADLNDNVQAGNDKLDDLNNKADEIITGSPEDQQQAADMNQDANDLGALADKLQQDLNGFYEPSADDVDLSIDGLTMGNGSWLASYGNVWSYLASDKLWQQVLTIVASMVWVSTLLFGRK